MSNYKENLKAITTFVFDFDGVFTDGIIHIKGNGRQLRTVFSKDGYAIQLALKHNFKIAIITGANAKSIKQQFKRLGISVFLKAKNKIEVFNQYLRVHNIDRKEVLVMGDDIPDYKIMLAAKIATCPADAVPEIIEVAHYISKYPGGRGCVRDVIEQVLRSQNKWMNGDAFHW
ncbi:MAG: HAD hydrolase family protein [Bacteroidales bacterium]|nr:HAD hydrolase family protein [Bacteroidales bacterium]